MDRLIRNIAVLTLIAAFLLPVLGFAVGQAARTGNVIEAENRTLSDAPRYRGDLRAFTQDVDSFLEDRFGFRSLLILIARKVRDSLGEDPPQVVYGRDGWMFLGSLAYRDEFEGQGSWNSAQVERWIASLSDVRTQSEAQGVPFVAAVAVDKARVYPEYVPAGWKGSARRFRAALHAHPGAASAGLLDIEPLVLAAKRSGETVFYRRDTHWTPSGSYDAAMALMDRLDPTRTRPRYRPDPPLEVAPDRLMDLERLASIAEPGEPAAFMIRMPATGPNYRQFAHMDDNGRPVRGELATLRLEGSADAPDGRLVVVGDSFADTLIPHLLPSYSEIVRIHFGAHIYDVDPMEVFGYDPDAVLFLPSERQSAVKARPFSNVPPQ
ncbi:MAG: hypothetical protein WBF53_01830 [Litorimonas sp.]